MKINEIIRSRRLQQKLTQEQMAERLGVSAPAVNKWEKGVSYPDITLLPALARLLDTDLNTLLSFREELSVLEITEFINELSKLWKTDGFERAYEAGMEKVRAYPNCYLLILNVVLSLEGMLIYNGVRGKEEKSYGSIFEEMYERVLASPDVNIRSQAQSMLISKYMARKEFEKAEALLEMLPDKNPVDKKLIQSRILLERGQLEDAARMEEEQLLTAVNEVHRTLLMLLDISLKEERWEDGKLFADKVKDTAKMFDMWKYTSYLGQFEYYSYRKDKKKFLEVLFPMLDSLDEKWDISASFLYRHVQKKSGGESFGQKLKEGILNAMFSDEEFFLKDAPELEELRAETLLVH